MLSVNDPNLRVLVADESDDMREFLSYALHQMVVTHFEFFED